MTILDKIARAIANVQYPDKPGSEAYATADRVIAALREPDEATIERMIEIYNSIKPVLFVCIITAEWLEAVSAPMRAAYAAIWSEK